MDKASLRREIREKKRAMTEQEIVRRSEKLAALFAEKWLFLPRVMPKAETI